MIGAQDRPRTASASVPGWDPREVRASQRMARTGRILSGFVAFFLFVDGGARLVGFAPYVEGTVRFGYPAWTAPWIGLTLLASTLFYVVPRTAVLGAILLTGYLGGAAASHARAEDPWLLFPVVLGAMAWGGLYLRDARLRAILPLRKPSADR